MKLLIASILIVCEIVSYLIYCKGFFPTKVLLTPEELTNFRTEPPKGYQEPSKQFDRVVFMLVDAMRSDFVFSSDSKMNFTQELINDGYAIGYTAFSNPPTVTLPRLKGITTGSIPNFIDAVLNIADDDSTSTLGNQDSWVKQMYLSGWNIHFFGDDTWLKLFPDYFNKSDGTSSFYVSDYTIVDHNVTRHLPEQLSADGLSQWNCMILHYLGLDHIGHKGGSKSANMPAKQVELDHVIKQIYERLLAKDDKTLMVLIGDHGMNDAGNHGGSSLGEVSSGMVLMSKKFKNRQLDGLKGFNVPIPNTPDYSYLNKADQIDLVPTLAELVGLNIPINSLGTFLPLMLPLYSEKDQLNILIKNALQLKVLLDKSLDVKFTKPLEEVCDPTSKDSLLRFIHSIKHELSEASSDYHYPDLYLGYSLYLFFSLICLGCFIYEYRNLPLSGLADLIFFITYGSSFIGSSLIEEEHHFWWLGTLIFVVYNCYVSIKAGTFSFSAMMLLLISLRIIKAWNNSGQKYNSIEFIKFGTYLTSLPAHEGPNLYALVLGLSFLPFFILKVKDSFGVNQTFESFASFVSLTMLISILASIKMLSFLTSTYDLDTGNAGLQQWWIDFIDWFKKYSGLERFADINNQLYRLFQYVWLITAVVVFLQPRVSRRFGVRNANSKYTVNVLLMMTFLAMSQTNFINVPLYAVMYFAYTAFKLLFPKFNGLRRSNFLSLLTILLQNMCFFQFGSTNSLASVDLKNSFNGLTSYNVILSGILTFIANWAAPIFWTTVFTVWSLDLVPASQLNSSKWEPLKHRMLFNLTFYSIAGLLLMFSCYNLRFHLFIWTVFSPKVLYFLAWIGSNLIVDLGLSSLIIAMDVN